MEAALPALMEAEFGIRQLHARCADAVWRKDTQEFADCYTAEGIWKVAGLEFQGREAIAGGFDMLTSVNQRILMRFATPIVQRAGDMASARTYAMEHVKRNDGTGLSSIGVYYERFKQTGSEWRFTWRHFDFCYFGPSDLSAELFAFSDYGSAPAMPAADGPTAGLQAE